MMQRNYEYLVAEYARNLSNLKYLLVFKHFDNINNKIEEFEIESERILTELEKLVNEKEPA